MKKILMLLLVILSLVFIPEVKAQEHKLNIEYHSGIYFVRTGGTVHDKTGKFPIFHLGDNLAYCIDPSKNINTDDYVSSDGYVDLPYSNEVLEQLELYGYYGREYPGHDNIRYSMAAQALIWEKAGGQTVTYWTKPYGEGEEIDVSKEKNEIKELVKKHRIIPDLPTNVYGDVLHESIVEDKNKALDNFEIRDKSSEYEAYIENNKLHITPKKQGIFEINLQRKKYDDLNTIIFVGKDGSETQPLGLLRFSDLSEQRITLSVDGVHIFLQKIDENNEPVKQMNIGFKIKNLSTGEYLCDFDDCSYWTDPVGSFVTNGLDFGEYEIEEIEDQIIKGYTWNSEKVIVNINEDNISWNKDKLSYIDVTFKNNSVSASLELTKKGEKAIFKDDEIKYQKINLENISFDLYDENNTFIKNIVTDNNGYTKVDNLKVGKYYLLEKTSLDKYIKTDKIPFEIKQDNTYQTHIDYRLTVNNYLKKGKLELNKVDDSTNIGIPNTIIEIYNDNNELLLTKKTDESGKVIIDNLPLGKYYIKEKEANYYYQKTDDIINFEIKENGDVIKEKMTNKKIIGEVSVNKYGEVFNIVDNDIKNDFVKLSDIEFDLFDNDNKLIDTLKTDCDGFIKKELPLGKYYLQEKTKLAGYQDNNEKYYFEIKKDCNEAIPVNLNINNYLKKGILEFDKTDLVSGEGIPNTIIEIYNNNDELLLTKETNEIGKVIINDLPIGKYYIQEKEANSMYKLTNEMVYFEIKDNNELVKANMTNEKITIPVPKTDTKESTIAHSIVFVCLFIGVGGLIYERKESF